MAAVEAAVEAWVVALDGHLPVDLEECFLEVQELQIETEATLVEEVQGWVPQLQHPQEQECQQEIEHKLKVDLLEAEA